MGSRFAWLAPALTLSLAGCGSPTPAAPDAFAPPPDAAEVDAGVDASSPADTGPARDVGTRFGTSTGASCPSPAVTYAAFGQTFFATHCTRCHASTLTGTARNGAPAGYDFDSIEGVRAVADAIDQVAGSGPAATNTFMPLSGSTPTLEERQSLAQMLACGVPD